MSEAPGAKFYHKVKNWFFYFETLLDLLILYALQVLGLSVDITHFVRQFFNNPWLVHAAYLFFFSAIFYVLHFPINYFLSFYWEHRFKLSQQKFLSWFKDDCKRVVLSFAILLVMVEIVYFFLGRFEASWWVGAAVVWLFISLFLARIMPNFIIPLFYKYSKIDDDVLRDRLFALFEKCKVNLEGVYQLNLSKKTNKANAFVCGLGSKRRVVLGDTLLSNFSVEQIEAVVAHELAHYKNRDIIKLIGVNTVFVCVGFFLTDKVLRWALGGFDLQISDIAGFPLLTMSLMVFGLLSAPLLNAFSRFLETKADDFCLRITNDPTDFISMMEKLADMNLAELEPHWFNEIMFYDHPPITKRIRYAKKFKGV